MKNKMALASLMILLSLPLIAADAFWSEGPAITPSSPAAGDVVTIRATIKVKEGTITNLRIIGKVDDKIIYERIFASIPENAQRKISFPWNAEQGVHTISLQLDPDKKSGDSNRKNNDVSIKVNVKGETPQEPVEPPKEELPDLMVSDAWTSPTVEIGSKMLLNCDIQNKGGDLKGKWIVRFLIDNTEVASKEFTDFKADGYQKYDAEFTSQNLGLHTLICQADPKNEIKESDENNNSWSYPFKIVEKAAALPDLSVKKVWVEPQQIQEGEGLSLNCSYEYDQGTASKPFDIRLVVRNIGSGLGNEWSKKDTKSGDYSAKWQATLSGNYNFYCAVDRGNEIAESDETNNTKGLDFTANPKTKTPKQDMYFSDIRTITENDKTISLCCGLGTNNFSQPFTYDYILDGQKIYTQESKNGLGGCYYYALEKLTAGTHTLECVIDPQNKVPESNENNNYGSKTFEAEKRQPLPDLLAQSVGTDKKQYYEGEEVQVVCFYKNIGGAFEGKWRLMIFVGGDSEYSDSVINTSGYVPWIWKAKGKGKYNVGCSLDTQQQVTESNEKNNVVTDTIEVVPLQGIILFKHDNYNGTQEIFLADDPDLRNNIIGNDKASSIKVPQGCVATLFEHINYQGKYENFKADDSWLGDNLIGNDSVSSIKVKCGR